MLEETKIAMLLLRFAIQLKQDRAKNQHPEKIILNKVVGFDPNQNQTDKKPLLFNEDPGLWQSEVT